LLTPIPIFQQTRKGMRALVRSEEMNDPCEK
jgi:hypothetical protein